MPIRSTVADDEAWMARALAAAARARGCTSPNPMVGAVVVSGGREVGIGYHARAGAPHAEPVALAMAGRHARGATLYVTLEPCHHTGRTGPCTDAIVDALITRVVVGAADNDERVQGRGIEFLRAGGIEVVTGVGAEACSRLNSAYHYAKAHQRSFVSAVACDTFGEGGRRASAWRQALRRAVDAIVIGPDAARDAEQDASARADVAPPAEPFTGDDGSLGAVDRSRRPRRPPRKIVIGGDSSVGRRWRDAGFEPWSPPAGCARPLAWLARACFEAGLYHVCLEGDASWVRTARQEGVLCRSFWRGRDARPLEGGPSPDWSRQLSSSQAIYGAWEPVMRSLRAWQPLAR